MSSFLEKRMGLAGKFAIILGGGGGLGRASAYDLGRAGVTLALADRDKALLDETVARLRADGAKVALAEVFDVREPGELERFFKQADEVKGGKLDVLVNVVGGTFRKDFADTTPRAWDSLIRTNFTWLLHAVHMAIPRMRAAGGGSIISFTSIEGSRAAPGFAVYAGMKAAVENFTRTLALELGPENIRLNTVAPDITPTEGTEQMISAALGTGPERKISEAISIPMGRFGVYEDVGGCVLFLASDLARYVTGTCVRPDGGTWASAGWLNFPGYGYNNSAPPDLARYLAGKVSTQK
jgi:NAD(P)-dependent dehydrogenase (short-subunit alcohol dehydrogenase family)